MARWTAANIPPQDGRLAVVTGAGGLGYEDALALAHAGADVVIASRNPERGAEAVRRIHSQAPSGSARFEVLDLANLDSVAVFARRLLKQTDRLDILINNAGVMVPPKRRVTTDGFELQLGTNHLGHFALTGRLLPLLRATPGARVVSLSSVAARGGAINFDDLNAATAYNPMQVYSQSKLACLMFALELQRRSEAGGWGVASIAAHPGVSRTDLLHNGAGRWSVHGMIRSLAPVLFQPVAQGALPTLYAATSPDAHGGGYYGPDRMGETRGYPRPAKIPPLAQDHAAAMRLWDASETLTGVRFADASLSPTLCASAASRSA
jgi:NAD(P)-dependent dehydrogenase (short-subunit alcohol dehydrogenase family)